MRSAPDAVGSAPLGPFPSEVSRQTSEPIREAPPGGPSEELFSCARTLRRTCFPSDSTGYYSQMHLLTILEPPAMCLRLWSSVASYPLHLPTAARDSRTEYSSMFPRGNCVAGGRHSDRARGKNAQLTHATDADAPDSAFLLRILTSKVRNTADFEAFIRPPERAKPLAACSTAFVFHSRRSPRKMPAALQYSKNC